MKKRIFAALLALAMIFVLASCGTRKDNDKDITAFVGTAIFEESMDPVKGAMTWGYDFVCNPLIKVNTDSEYVPDLATDWTISPNGLNYTFHLRKGVTFSDGSPFTSEDVAFTYNTIKERQAENQNVDLTRLQSVRTPDDYTVQFVLSEPYSPFLDTTAQVQIVPNETYNSKTFDRTPIGTGAWKVVEYDPNQQIILEANKNCFNGAPKLNRVTLVYMEEEAAFAAAKSGQLDVVMVSPNYATQKVRGMKMQSFETMDVRNISLPVHPRQTVKDKDGKSVVVGNNVTSDKAVREALSIGVNRKQIIQDAFNGVGVPAVNFTDNLTWASTNNFKDNQVSEAKKILDDAGWKVGSDGYRVKNGQKCEFDVYGASNDPDRYSLAAALAENARKLGIKINAKTASWDEISGSLKNAEGVVWGWGQYNPNVLVSLFQTTSYPDTPAFNNVVGYSNPKVDRLINQALAATSKKSADAIWKQVQDVANKDYPYLYLVNIRHCYFVNKNLNIPMDTQIPHPHGHGSPIICNMQDWSMK